MRVSWNTPGVRSIRTADPNRWTAERIWASSAVLTVSSTSTTTWLVTGSIDQAVPVMVGARSSAAVTSSRSAVLRATSLGTAPDARTATMAAASVTLTTIRPVALSK